MQGAQVRSLVRELRSHMPQLIVPIVQLKILHVATEFCKTRCSQVSVLNILKKYFLVADDDQADDVHSMMWVWQAYRPL